MSRLMTRDRPGGQAPAPTITLGGGAVVEVSPVCNFLDCDDVPDITAVQKSAAVRWDTINRVFVSTERERRFLFGEERRRGVNEDGVRRGGPEAGLRGEAKQARGRLGFLKIGDEPAFVSKEFPKWDPQGAEAHT